MSHTESIFDSLLNGWPRERWQDFTVLVALSGGADSVCLTRIIDQIFREQGAAKGHLELIHVNHNVRSCAINDENWVKRFADQLEIPIHVCQIDPNELRCGGQGLESALREQRYRCYEDVANRIGGRYVLTGHHADDQVETVLHRIFRGTGISGLKGIPFSRPLNNTVSVVRPLLSIRKLRIVEQLQEWNQAYCDDPTNREAEFTRNQIRNELLPQLRQMFGDHMDQSVLRLVDSAKETDDFLADLAKSIDDAFDVQVGQIRVDRRRCQSSSRLLIRRNLVSSWPVAGFGLQGMTKSKWDQVADWIMDPEFETVNSNLPGDVQVKSDQRSLTFSKNLAESENSS